MILKNISYLVTQNKSRDILEDVDLLIKDGKIAGIGRELPRGENKVIDCSGMVILPGLINAHTHSSMTLLRGVSDNKKLEDWLHDDIFPAEDKMEGDDVFVGSLLACVEMLKTGTTCFNDMYADMDRVAEAVEDSGIRAMLGRGLMDVEGGGEESLSKAINFVESFQDNSRVHTCFAPHAIYTASDQLLLDAKECSEFFDVPYHIHVSETEKEVSDSLDERGKSPLEHLNDLDIVDKDLIAAHGVWLTEEDKNILEETEGSVVHNPSANLKLGSGVANIPELMGRSINVALGTDGPASNNNLNLFEEAKIASILHKKDNPELINEQEVLDMATINGANALGLEHLIGSIEIGKRADLIGIDLERPEMKPIHGKGGLISNLVYSFGGEVDLSIVDGEILIKNREMKDFEYDRLVAAVEEASEKLKNY